MNIINRIKNKIKYICDRKIAKSLVEREEINPLAEQPEEYVYVIRRYPGAGFFSDFFYVLSHMEYANKKWGQLKFVVDMENYPTLYKEDESLDGITNQWEYYFRQPSSMKVTDIDKCGHIIYSSNGFKTGDIPLYAGLQAPKVFPTQEVVNEINRRYLPCIPFTESTLEYINKGRDIFENKKVLGIHLRGTDMIIDPTHPNPFTLDNLIDFIMKYELNQKYDKFFVCSDTEKYVEIMKKIFPDKTIVLDALRATNDIETGIHKQKNGRYRNKYKMGLEVIKDMMWLAMCDGLVCGHSNVTYAAIVYNNNKYKHLFVWNGNEYEQNI